MCALVSLFLLVVVAIGCARAQEATPAPTDHQGEEPGRDIAGRLCNAGSIDCECLDPSKIDGRARCGYMMKCVKAEDDAERCKLAK